MSILQLNFNLHLQLSSYCLWYHSAIYTVGFQFYCLRQFQFGPFPSKFSCFTLSAIKSSFRTFHFFHLILYLISLVYATSSAKYLYHFWLTSITFLSLLNCDSFDLFPLRYHLYSYLSPSNALFRP